MAENETVALPVLTCQRCGARWIAKSTKLPVSCAKCRSKFWRTPPKQPAIISCPHCDWTAKFFPRDKPGRYGTAEDRAINSLQNHVKKRHGIDALLKLKFGSED